MKTLLSILPMVMLASPAASQLPPPQIGAVSDPCAQVAPMPPEVAAYFAAVSAAHVGKTTAPVPTAAQLGIYRRWQAQVKQQDFAQLCTYAAANAALPPPSPRRIVYFGDSITELWGANDPDFFRGDVLNRGISGQTTLQMLPRFRADVIDLKPAVVHIIAGTNDVAGNTGPTSLDRIVDAIATMIELAKLHGIRVVLGSELPCARYQTAPAQRPAEVLPELNSRLRKLAGDQGVAFVDYYTPLVDAQGGFDARFSNDGLHPTAAGYAVMAPLARSAIALVMLARPTQPSAFRTNR